MPEKIKISLDCAETRLIARAVRIMETGGVIAYPTETFYALGTNAENKKAVEKIFAIKGRDAGKPLPVIIGSQEELSGLTEEVPPGAHLLMKEFWPGALTLVFRASSRIPPHLTAGTGKIGIRLSNHPVASLLAKHLAHPLTATSANISGEGECSTAAQVRKRLGDRIDAIVDGGRSWGEIGSTILDMTSEPPAILREGAIPSSLLFAILEKNCIV